MRSAALPALHDKNEDEPVLRVEGLSKRFRDFQAVAGVSFTVQPGEIFGILGPNGAGKSTTIAMLCGLRPPDGGTASICGHDLVHDAKQVKRLIGLVPQEIALYPTLTARDNLEYFGAMYGMRGVDLRRRVNEVLEAVSLSDWAAKPVKVFSGGMKRRINIAAGLLHDPTLLFLDEPTVGVDPQSRTYIYDLIRRLNQQLKMTVIYTSHYMEEVQMLCNRVAIMDHGQIIALDSVRGLLDTHGSSALLIRLEAGEGDLEHRLRQAFTAIAGLRSVKPMPTAGDGTVVFKVDVEEPGRALMEVTMALNDAHLPVLGMEVQLPNLEAVFLELTGRRLRD